MTVEASQVEYVQAFGQWLKSYKRNEPRPSFVDVLAGKRRGGKTWVMVALILAAVAIPYRTHTDGQRVTFVGWLVVPSYPEQRELHEDILAVIRAGPRTSGTSRRARWCLCCGRSLKSGGITDRIQRTATCSRTGRRCFKERQPTGQPEAGPRGCRRTQRRAKVDSEARSLRGQHNRRRRVADHGGKRTTPARGQWLKEVKYACDDGRMVNPNTGQQVVRWFWVNPDKTRASIRTAETTSEFCGAW